MGHRTTRQISTERRHINDDRPYPSLLEGDQTHAGEIVKAATRNPEATDCFRDLAKFNVVSDSTCARWVRASLCAWRLFCRLICKQPGAGQNLLASQIPINTW